MRLVASRLVACSLIGLLTACGSSGGTIPPPPPSNLPSVVTISPQFGVSGVAYRIGSSGSWTPGSTTATTQFTVPLGTTIYSVAYACSGFENDQTVVNLAVTDTLVVPATCAPPVVPDIVIPPTTVNGTFDATAVGATAALVSATNDHADVSVASGAGSYSNLVTERGTQTFVLGGKNAIGDYVGFKALHAVPPAGGPSQTVDFPALTAADAAVSEPFSVTGATGSANAAGVAYLLDGTSAGFYVTHASHTSYSGVPSADWASGDSYGVFVQSWDTIGNDQYGTFHLGRTTSTAPVAVTLPVLGHIAVNHADLSFPLTYASLSPSDVVKGYLLAEFDGPTRPEYDIATPAFLAGKQSYGPPSFAGTVGFVTKTATNVSTAEYAVVGFSFQPSPTTITYLEGFPAPGQSVEAYLSIYSPGAAPAAGSGLRLMQKDRVPIGILEPRDETDRRFMRLVRL